MMKTEVYSWRVRPALKSALEDAARKRDTSVARVLDEAATAWLRGLEQAETEDAMQRRVREAATPYLGSIRGGDPHRAEQSSQRVRAALRTKHARNRPH